MQTVGTFTVYESFNVDNMPLPRTEFQTALEKMRNKDRQQRWRDKRKENPGEHSEFKSAERVRVAAYFAKQRREMSETDKQAKREDERLRKAAYRRKKREGQTSTGIEINEPKATTPEKEMVMERATVDKVPFCINSPFSFRLKA